MFGYLTAFQPELRVRELDTYKAVYCGLCHCLRSHYGMASSAGLSYDFVFLAALGLALEEEEPRIEQRRCVTHPVKRRAAISGRSATLYTAAMQVLLGCGKLEDDLADESGYRKARAAAGLAALRRARRLAQQEYPDQAASIARQLTLLGEAQSCQAQSLDSYTHHSGWRRSPRRLEKTTPSTACSSRSATSSAAGFISSTRPTIGRTICKKGASMRCTRQGLPQSRGSTQRACSSS